MLRLAPDKFWSFSAKLFEQQKDFFDVYVVNETRNQTYRRLAKVAGQVGVDEAELYGLLEVPDKEVDGGANVGNKVTDDVKLMVKVGVSEEGWLKRAVRRAVSVRADRDFHRRID